jgi:hypothetical protein
MMRAVRRTGMVRAATRAGRVNQNEPTAKPA